MRLRALTWNLRHGRDHPVDPALETWRSRLLGSAERSGDRAQVNRDLLAEFAQLLANADWDVALLQEAPPRWARPLMAAAGCVGATTLTSRNSLAPLRSLVARLRPDLIASNEGGSNLTLVRGRLLRRRELELSPGPRPERRVMGFVEARVGGVDACVANLHLSAGAAMRHRAESELVAAAERAVAWSDGRALIVGGDLNLRPRDTTVFDLLSARFELAGTTAPDSLDHLLARGLERVEGPTTWSSARREVEVAEGLIRLSDHPPVQATFVPIRRGCDGATADVR